MDDPHISYYCCKCCVTAGWKSKGQIPHQIIMPPAELKKIEGELVRHVFKKPLEALLSLLSSNSKTQGCRSMDEWHVRVQLQFLSLRQTLWKKGTRVQVSTFNSRNASMRPTNRTYSTFSLKSARHKIFFFF